MTTYVCVYITLLYIYIYSYLRGAESILCLQSPDTKELASGVPGVQTLLRKWRPHKTSEALSPDEIGVSQNLGGTCLSAILL